LNRSKIIQFFWVSKVLLDSRFFDFRKDGALFYLPGREIAGRAGFMS